MRIRWYILPTLIIIGLMGWIWTIECEAANLPDFSQKGSITVVMKNEETDKAVPGGELCLYYVAEMQEQGMKYCYTNKFAICGFSLKDMEDDLLPKKLAEFAETQNVSGVKKEIDENGTAVYEDLTAGLYLVIQTKEANGYYKINPFLISVPMQEDEQWIYDVCSLPKMESLSEKIYSSSTTISTPTTQKETLIPKTGQLWWPVPVLAFAGSACILIGLMLKKWETKNAK